MKTFEIIGLRATPTLVNALDESGAIEMATTLWPHKNVLSVVRRKGEVIWVHEGARESAHTACNEHLAGLPVGDPRTRCETRHALDALHVVGNNASARDFKLALRVQRAACPRCNLILRKSRGIRYEGKQIVNKVVTFAPKSRGRAHFDNANMVFAVSKYSRTNGRKSHA